MTTRIGVDSSVYEMKETLISYIEATYHISNLELIRKRRSLLEEVGTIAQAPYIESTPLYETGDSYFHLGLHKAAEEVLRILSTDDGELKRQVFDPPYHHQSEAVKAALVDSKSLMVTTGTGSGKTESFLFPILGKLAIEANMHRETFANVSAVRAIVLYPMNALVNDQLGRIRLLFSDDRVVKKFKEWAGRPPRFARYTSRTPYAGEWSGQKDRQRLAFINDYYVKKLTALSDPDVPASRKEGLRTLINELKVRGKWPAKPDLEAWWGKGFWEDRTGQPLRCLTLPDDSELMTRHEVLAAPPDVLITNYSMLEYMLMRPIESPIFDSTVKWLDDNPKEKIILVLDEAHMYYGASGTEVAHLIRRLRTRLNISPERLQVICTSASFNNAPVARTFASELTGKDETDFVVVEGRLAPLDGNRPGGDDEVNLLETIDTNIIRDQCPNGQLDTFLNERSVKSTGDLPKDLFEALKTFGPLLEMKKNTMSQATSLDELQDIVFPGMDKTKGATALSVLMELGSMAKAAPNSPSLFPSRIHALFRYLPGLWVCLNPNCEKGATDLKFGPLFTQPSSSCPSCDSRVFEFFTCRNCGRAYARGYTDDVIDPTYLWSGPGESLELSVDLGIGALEPLDMLLEDPAPEQKAYLEYREIDLQTGRLDTMADIEFVRGIWVRKDRRQIPGHRLISGGQMDPCGACGKESRNSESSVISSVQDHITKGDQPFHSVVAKQISTQVPSPIVDDKSFAPLEGRKVLAFSDSRQAAARLAPNIASYSIQDNLRPLILKGFEKLNSHPSTRHLVNLSRLYLAAQIGAFAMGVRIRPDLTGKETYSDRSFLELFEYMEDPDTDPLDISDAIEQLNDAACPRTLMSGLMKASFDPHTGLEACGLAVLEESKTKAISTKIEALPGIPGVAEHLDEKRELVRDWIRQFIVQRKNVKINGVQPIDLNPQRGRKALVKPHHGRFRAILKTLLGGGANEQTFLTEWLPILRETFCEAEPSGDRYFLNGNRVVLESKDVSWQICGVCRTPQRERQRVKLCLHCKRDSLVALEPTQDEIFLARTKYYRAQTDEMLNNGSLTGSMIVAKEHTAQLNQMQQDEAVSLAEKYELLFQDVKHEIDDSARNEYAVDLLSCTTTMEVGIDIGGLSGVALRNMPPSRANYQQRAGRAGRRSDSVATVVSVAGSDSHDVYHYKSPQNMVRGPVEDPILCLDNVEIAKRHITAYLIQRYLTDRLQAGVLPDPIKLANVFSVLGSVYDFLCSDSIPNRDDFKKWVEANDKSLIKDLEAWVPHQLGQERTKLLKTIGEWPLSAIDEAIGSKPESSGTGESIKFDNPDVPEEEGGNQADADIKKESLLDRLFYRGVLPRYAFPTDLANFYVFDRDKSFKEKKVSHRYSPSQGTRIALTQYAPGRTVWIDSREWKSGALYSPIDGERDLAWESREVYLECSRCGYAKVVAQGVVDIGNQQECPGCGELDGLGPARYWVHPPGFAHPFSIDENTADDDTPSMTRASRAVLTTQGNVDQDSWTDYNSRIKFEYLRENLLSTNRGDTNREGFRFCPECGAIEIAEENSLAGQHSRPVPMVPTQCSGIPEEGITLGTRFLTDVLLLRISVDEPLRLNPAQANTTIALKTVCDALSQAGSMVLLDRSTNELEGNFRTALTPKGKEGYEVEIYLYDTLDGGAGFTKVLSSRLNEVFDEALKILEERCTCQDSCYDCLRSFSNRFDHETLDRHIGASFLRYMMHGTPVEQPLALERRSRYQRILFEDLQRQPIGDFEVLFNQAVSLPDPFKCDFTAPILMRPKSGGKTYAFFLNNTLTPDHIQNEVLMDYRDNALIQDVEIHLIDELIVMKNLPAASIKVLEIIGI